MSKIAVFFSKTYPYLIGSGAGFGSFCGFIKAEEPKEIPFFIFGGGILGFVFFPPLVYLSPIIVPAIIWGDFEYEFKKEYFN
jgi:hypothetical protein